MVFDRVRDALSEDEEGSSGVTMPSDASVLRSVSSEVDLSHEETREVVEKFQETSQMVQPMVAESAVEDRGAQHRKEDESPSFIYTVFEDEDVLAVGGAKNIMMGLTDRLDLDSVERKAVVLAHRRAAEQAGLSQHTVMDDVYMVPKKLRFEGSLNRDEIDIERMSQEDAGEALQRKMERVQEVDEDGFELAPPKELTEPIELDSRKLLGVEHGYEGDVLQLVLDPRRGGDTDWPGVMDVEGVVSVPDDLADVLDVEGRTETWGVDDGRLICVLESKIDADERSRDTLGTAITSDDIAGTHRAVLPSGRARDVGIHEGDDAGFYLEAIDGDMHVVVTPDSEEGAAVTIENIGPGAEMLAIELPEAAVELLEVDAEHPVEWMVRSGSLVGRVARR